MSEDPRLQRVMQILTAVLEHPEKERLDCLRQECHDDESLLSDLQSLLEHHEQAEREDFLGRTSLEPGRIAFDGSPPVSDTTAQHNVSTPNNTLQVRCPHCHTPTSVAVDASLEDISCPSCGSVFSLVSDDNATYSAATMSRIGHFELIERLGFGGFGSVWKARDTKLDRTVAVKLPRQGQMDVAETEKFFREARAAAQLRHPNIVGVHEVGRDDGSMYIVSDFVRGVTIDDWLTGQQLTSREAAELCIPIAAALEHAHEQGIVHRDLKPGNIMLDGDGVPHLMDFGLARREAGEVTMTIDGQVLGTPAYMSPEQAEGQAHVADRRSDIYSLGVILFKLVTGELPFRGNTRMLIHQVINKEPPSPRTMNANVPKDFETIVLKCLEKDPERRYQTAQDLADELQRFLNYEPIHARPVGRLERTWRWCKRNPVVAGLTAAVASALLIGIITTSFFAVLAERRATEAVQSERVATSARSESDAALKREKLARDQAVRSNEQLQELTTKQQRLLYLHDTNDATRLLLTSYPEYALKHVYEELTRPVPTVGKGFEFRYLLDRLMPDRTVLELDDVCSSVGIARTGTRIAAGTVNGRIVVWNQKLDVPALRITAHEGQVCCVVFSDGHNAVASAGEDQAVYLWNLESGEKVSEFRGAEAKPMQLSFCMEGHSILCVTEAGDVLVWDVATANLISNDRIDHEFTRSAVSLDGSTIAVGSTFGGIVIWDTNQRRISHLLSIGTNDSDELLSLAFSPDGRYLSAGYTYGNDVICWDVASGKEQWRIRQTDPYNTFHAFRLFELPDKRFLSMDWSGLLSVWNRDRDLRELQFMAIPMPVAVEHTPSFCVDVTPDGNSCVVGCLKQLHLFDIGKHLRRTIRHCEPGANYAAIDWISHSQSIAIVCTNGRIEILNTASGTCDTFDVPIEDKVGTAAVSCDGALLALFEKKGTIHLVDLTARQPVGTIETGESGDEWKLMAFSPTSPHSLATTGNLASRIQLWDTHTRSKVRERRIPMQVAIDISFSSDGEQLIVVGLIGQPVEWNTTTNQVSVHKQVQGVGVITYSQGGAELVLGGWNGNITLCDNSFHEIQRFVGTTSHCWGASFCDNDTRLLTHSQFTDEIYLWDRQTGNLTATYQLPLCAIGRIALSHDSTCLALLDTERDTVRLLHAPLRNLEDMRRNMHLTDIRHRAEETVDFSDPHGPSVGE